MSQEIDKLLKMRAISPNNYNSGYLSPIFLREKANGSHRLIFNLKRLNFYIRPPKFRLINLKKVAQTIQKGDFLIKIDISNAYYHIPIAHTHRRYLSLAWNGQIYNMQCLPFGLSSAPSIFSKVSNWVASLLRDRGMRVIVYLDDYLLMNQNHSTLIQQAQWTVSFLKDLGWELNLQKCDLNPKKQLEYLGLIWDTERNIIALPESKITNITNTIEKALRRNRWSWRDAKHILGKLNFASNAVPLGFLHCRPIQMAAKTLPDEDRHKTFRLPIQAKEELLWWLQNLNNCSTLQVAPPTAFITTDASDHGWGAIVNDKKLFGHWNAT